MKLPRAKGNLNVFYLLLLAFIVIFLCFFIKNSYYFLILNLIGLSTMMVVGLNLFMGYAGQISIGHAAFYGIGAYLSGILSTHFNSSVSFSFGIPQWCVPWIAIFIAMLCTGSVAYLVGLPTMKLKGNYLVMATLGFNIIFELVVVEWHSLTGGSNGMAGVPYLRLGNFSFNNDIKCYFLIWGFTLLTLIVSFNLVESRVGRALKAIHGSEVAANMVGINTQRYKVKIFVLSAMVSSLAGSMYAHYVTVITPKSFDASYSIQLVLMVIVGGMGSIWGSLFGAILLVFLSEVFYFLGSLNVVVLGFILVLVMIFLPKGLIPSIFGLFTKRNLGTGNGYVRNY
jgi:branched-chain amino acid transport system permease protein